MCICVSGRIKLKFSKGKVNNVRVKSKFSNTAFKVYGNCLLHTFGTPKQLAFYSSYSLLFLHHFIFSIYKFIIIKNYDFFLRCKKSTYISSPRAIDVLYSMFCNSKVRIDSSIHCTCNTLAMLLTLVLNMLVFPLF